MSSNSQAYGNFRLFWNKVRGLKRFKVKNRSLVCRMMSVNEMKEWTGVFVFFRVCSGIKPASFRKRVVVHLLYKREEFSLWKSLFFRAHLNDSSLDRWSKAPRKLNVVWFVDKRKFQYKTSSEFKQRMVFSNIL